MILYMPIVQSSEKHRLFYCSALVRIQISCAAAVLFPYASNFPIITDDFTAEVFGSLTGKEGTVLQMGRSVLEVMEKRISETVHNYRPFLFS